MPETTIEQFKQAEIPLKEHEPLSRHTTFKIGGSVRLMVFPESLAQLKTTLSILRTANESPLIIGNGSNLLVCDAPLARVAIKLGTNFSSVRRDGNFLFAQAGTKLASIANFAQKEGLAGSEFAHGIPGSLGGAIVMNAGAYGGEMRDVVHTVHILTASGTEKNITVADCAFAYRHSRFQETGEIIFGATLSLAPGDPIQIWETMDSLMQKRNASQPYDKPSAGSTFRRPTTGYAAQMIDEAGLKGRCVGGAVVSEKHAGFIVNEGGASCQDVLELMAIVQDEVFAKFGIKLEPEVKVISAETA